MLNAQNVAYLPLILGLVQLALQMGMPKKLSPLLSVSLGVAAGIFYLAPHDYPTAVLLGLSLGLGAVGLHSGVKNVTEGVQSVFTSSPLPIIPPLTPQDAGQNPIPTNPAQPTAAAQMIAPMKEVPANVSTQQ